MPCLLFDIFIAFLTRKSNRTEAAGSVLQPIFIVFYIYLFFTINKVCDILSSSSSTRNMYMQKAIKINNVIIALFDPQLDYISKCPSAKEKAKWRPATALLSIDRLPIVSRYVLVTPREHLEAANRLIPLLENGIRGMIHTRIKDGKIANTIISKIEPSVKISEIEYNNIWNIRSCSESLKPILKDIITEGSALTKTAKSGATNGHKKPAIIISLLGSTTPARTALYLAAKLFERESGRFQLSLVKQLDYDGATNSTRLWAGTDISSTSNGLLRQGVGTQHPTYAKALDRLECVIQTSPNAKILLTGPTGAGKSELGRLIISYMQALHGGMNEKNCIVQNVAAIAPALIESELFGHEKGAYTGATGQVIGIFERAQNGILFLDEIGELPLYLQAKLLTILDGSPFTRVGGTEYISTRFLLLCGTNKDLKKECAEGRFRLDLFERINTWHIDVPPLKDRPGDIERALQRELGEWETAHKSKVTFADGAREFFLDKAKQYAWDGNFREFHAIFLHLALFSGKGGITKQAIKEEFNRNTSGEIDDIPLTSKTPPDKSGASGSVYDLAEMARLACALDVCRKCKTATEAGEILFAARLATARQKGTGFNGASSLQRVFASFGLEAHFKNGTFAVSPLTP